MDFAETIRGIFGGQSSQPPPTGEDYASDLKPMVDAGAEVRRKPRLSFDLYPPKPDHDPVLGEELHDILRSKDKVPSPDFIAPPPGLGQAPNRVPSDMQYERPPNVLSENAARGIAASAVEPFGQAGRLATGGSEDVAGDLAGVGAAVAPIPGAGIGKAIGKAAKAGIEGAEHATTGGVADMIKAYHGSPHDFDRFDLSKIGTGEGAQAYGHGLYFAEHEGVAKEYRNALGRGDQVEVGGKPVDPAKATYQDQQALNWIKTAARDRASSGELADQAIDRATKYAADMEARGATQSAISARQTVDKLKEWKAAGLDVRNPGRMYEVGIRANPEHFLDWDKPLSEQHPKVREAFEPYAKEAAYQLYKDDHNALTPGEAIPVLGNRRAGTFGAAGRTAGANALTQELREAGIPGIKYLDQGSRLKPVSAERVKQIDRALAESPSTGTAADDARVAKLHAERKQLTSAETRNYVVFDDKLIDILKKYGIAGIGALPAMNAFHYQDKQ